VTRPAASLALIFAVVLALRLPFLNQPIQGDDLYYLYAAQHAQIEPLHPKHTQFVFQGETVDMRGHPHGPLNGWILGILLAILGDVREVPFHAVYTLFSLIAAWAMWSLAARFCERPLLATLLFIAVPAFVVNGNSFEADLPFLACWMAAIALFVRAVDQESLWMLAASSVPAELAGATSYQAVFLTPILGAYLWHHSPRWQIAWLAAFAAPAAIASLEGFERSTGALPAAMLAGYMQSHGLQALASKARSAAALVVHSGWIVSPLLVFAAVRGRWPWALAGATAILAAIFDPNPLFWLSMACGVMVLIWTIRHGKFLGWWIAVFFCGALIVFFAGSARYLLPMAGPVAILIARAASPGLLWTGFALQFALSVLLAAANYQQWNAYRAFAASWAPQVAARRVWVNAEWGLRYYLESEGALPLKRDQVLQPGELIVTSDLPGTLPRNAPMAQVAQEEITPAIPLRLISLSGRSAFSSAARGLLPFEISRAPADRVRVETVLERKAELSYLDPRDAASRAQLVSGIYPDGWMGAQATVLLKSPGKAAPLRVEVFIPPDAPARKVQMLVGTQVIAEDTFPKPGSYALAAPYEAPSASVSVTLTVDKTHRVAGDERDLGAVVTGVGFR
jgi:hypothetical protein